MESRTLTTDDDINSTTATFQLLDTIYINICIFVVLVAIFELSRGIKCLYLNRIMVSKFVHSLRVPQQPSKWPFSWVFIVLSINDDKVCEMVGLDAYMLLRFIVICMRAGFFFTFCGVVILIPIYASSDGGFIGWNRFTLANIPNNPEATELWAPVIFCYLFSAYFCQLMFYEYKNFIVKRVEYLVSGDRETPAQTYYTAMVEKLPKDIKSTPSFSEYCEKLFPGQVFSVEIAVDLKALETLVAHRQEIRNLLEKAIAVWHATSHRPTVHVKRDFYDGVQPPYPAPIGELTGLSKCWFSICCSCWGGSDMVLMDSIDHYAKVLEMMNTSVKKLQKFYFEQRLHDDNTHGLRLNKVQKILEEKTFNIFNTINSSTVVVNPHDNSIANVNNDSSNNLSNDNTKNSEEKGDITNESNESALKKDHAEAFRDAVINIGSTITDVTKSGAIIVGDVTKQGVEGLAKESLKTATFATKGALRAVFEATRALELLTLGERFSISSTAFVTFKSRVAACASHQVLISNKLFNMQFLPAPNPKDIIWQNIPISKSQIELRKWIADIAFQIGAIFWSIIVAFIATISNLDSISQVIPAIKHYSNTDFYILLNNYLALGLLVIILTILPYIFDFVSRCYEGIKLESEIQNSIMTRYFYYLLANVYVAVGLGSIATSLNEIVSSPTSILTILGSSLPSFSIYFTNFVVIKTCTGIPLEMLRVFPLLDIARVSMCINKKTVTRREMRTGAFADPPILYGWIYPNLLMILMIMITYSCIAPLVIPFCLLFFSITYIMYKYQLLYVYINEYQSGGFMWYAVFNRSMVALLCGVCVLLCYLLIRETFFTGPFYLLFPLPFMILVFWYRCDKQFKGPAMLLSLEEAVKIDRDIHESTSQNPHDLFSASLFRQPSLVEGPLKPAMYRKQNHSVSPSDGGSTNNSNRNSAVSNNISEFYSVFSSSPALFGSRENSPVDIESIEAHQSHPQRVIESSSSDIGDLMLDVNDSEAVEDQIDKLLEDTNASSQPPAIIMRGDSSNSNNGTFRGSIESTTYGMMFMERLRKSKGGSLSPTVLQEPLVEK